MISQSCRYGIHAALFLAHGDRAAFTPIREISERVGVSSYFLTKVLQHLTQEGILRSRRGPKGGVALKRPPAQVTLKELIVAIDGPEFFEACVLGLPGCGRLKPCPLHEEWSVVRGCIEAAFGEVTLAAMAAGSVAAERALEYVLPEEAKKFWPIKGQNTTKNGTAAGAPADCGGKPYAAVPASPTRPAR